MDDVSLLVQERLNLVHVNAVIITLDKNRHHCLSGVSSQIAL